MSHQPLYSSTTTAAPTTAKKGYTVLFGPHHGFHGHGGHHHGIYGRKGYFKHNGRYFGAHGHHSGGGGYGHHSGGGGYGHQPYYHPPPHLYYQTNYTKVNQTYSRPKFQKYKHFIHKPGYIYEFNHTHLIWLPYHASYHKGHRTLKGIHLFKNHPHGHHKHYRGKRDVEEGGIPVPKDELKGEFSQRSQTVNEPEYKETYEDMAKNRSKRDAGYPVHNRTGYSTGGYQFSNAVPKGHHHHHPHPYYGYHKDFYGKDSDHYYYWEHVLHGHQHPWVPLYDNKGKSFLRALTWGYKNYTHNLYRAVRNLTRLATHRKNYHADKEIWNYYTTTTTTSTTTTTTPKPKLFLYAINNRYPRDQEGNFGYDVSTSTNAPPQYPPYGNGGSGGSNGGGGGKVIFSGEDTASSEEGDAGGGGSGGSSGGNGGGGSGYSGGGSEGNGGGGSGGSGYSGGGNGGNGGGKSFTTPYNPKFFTQSFPRGPRGSNFPGAVFANEIAPFIDMYLKKSYRPSSTTSKPKPTTTKPPDPPVPSYSPPKPDKSSEESEESTEAPSTTMSYWPFASNENSDPKSIVWPSGSGGTEDPKKDDETKPPTAMRYQSFWPSGGYSAPAPTTTTTEEPEPSEESTEKPPYAQTTEAPEEPSEESTEEPSSDDPYSFWQFGTYSAPTTGKPEESESEEDGGMPMPYRGYSAPTRPTTTSAPSTTTSGSSYGWPPRGYSAPTRPTTTSAPATTTTTRSSYGWPGGGHSRPTKPTTTSAPSTSATTKMPYPQVMYQPQSGPTGQNMAVTKLKDNLPDHIFQDISPFLSQDGDFRPTGLRPYGPKTKPSGSGPTNVFGNYTIPDSVFTMDFGPISGGDGMTPYGPAGPGPGPTEPPTEMPPYMVTGAPDEEDDDDDSEEEDAEEMDSEEEDDDDEDDDEPDPPVPAPYLTPPYADNQIRN